jgi:hypothetical protein
MDRLEKAGSWLQRVELVANSSGCPLRVYPAPLGGLGDNESGSFFGEAPDLLGARSVGQFGEVPPTIGAGEGHEPFDQGGEGFGVGGLSGSGVDGGGGE